MSLPAEQSNQQTQTLPAWRQRAQVPALVGALLLLTLAAWIVWPRLQALAQRSPVGSRNIVARPTLFDISKLTIPREAILSGGPPKDGIPALSDPKMVPAVQAAFMRDADRVIGLSFNGEAKAYPLKILDYHEIVNDSVGEIPVAVTYCPLCDSSVTFDRRVGNQTKTFGVSGLLYQSNVLMFDRGEAGAEGLWSQMGSAAVSGRDAGTQLQRLPMEVTTWSDWRDRQPETMVVSVDTGHRRPYDRTAYASYFQSDRLMFPPGPTDDRLPAKTLVLGVTAGGLARAYPLPSEGETQLIDVQLGPESFQLAADPENRTLRVEQAGRKVEWCYAYWFAWYAFHPQTELHRWSSH